jgi:hypothetical protein
VTHYRSARLWYEDASAAVDYAKQSSRSHGAVIRVFNEAGNVIRNAQTRWRFQRTMSVSRDEAQSSI